MTYKEWFQRLINKERLRLVFTKLNYSEDERANKIAQYVLDHKSEFRFFRDKYEIHAVREDQEFTFLIENRWYGYLSHFGFYSLDKDGSRLYGKDDPPRANEIRPSRKLMYRFFEEIDQRIPPPESKIDPADQIVKLIERS